MKKLNTQVTIRSIISTKNKDSLINGAMSYIEKIDGISLNSEQKNDVKTCITEALNNVISFAYLDTEGKVEICISLYDGFFEIKIKDCGRGILDVKGGRHPVIEKMIDSGSTNTLIDQIFASVDDLIDGKLVCGAGGGGCHRQ